MQAVHLPVRRMFRRTKEQGKRAGLMTCPLPLAGLIVPDVFNFLNACP